MNFSEQCYRIFEQATKAYHVSDDVDATMHNPYEVKSIEFYLYLKNWIDAVQWHLEDIIRNPAIDPVEAVAIKRHIDKSNQDRTDLVELIDSFFLDKYKEVQKAYKMNIVADNTVPYLKGVAEPIAEIKYLNSNEFTPSTIHDADALIVRSIDKCTRRSCVLLFCLWGFRQELYHRPTRRLWAVCSIVKWIFCCIRNFGKHPYTIPLSKRLR